jgi:peroxiredoxin
MIELGELERRHEDFDRRKIRVVAVSTEGSDDARKSQADFPHLLLLSDEKEGLSRAADLIHAHQGPGGGDIDAPTTIVVDRRGVVRWLYRSGEVIARLSPDEVLQAADARIPK